MYQKYKVMEMEFGRKIVIINDLIFKKKKYVEWKEVKEYLKKYVGEYYTILSADEKVYIGSDFPNEFTSSTYTYSLKGANVKAKANAAQVIPQMIEIASGGNYRENNEGKVKYYNIFHASLLIRHDENGKKYLYDIIDIKKETSYPLEP